ncbi:MAG: hypothetical protein KIY12_04800 [Thermoplasmata archaeon]|uniref:Nudix hydrolase domain-containing protein n=1 Tax=Candidatus Sysuiplasma superficiale TaxID=2823368 RepID=A0A8J7YRS6_9ARCH|nr:hypothetical protein [Candidatus Sysuiplasma superficiale]
MEPRKKALFREGNVNPGGTCLSSFVVVSSGNNILVGKPSKPEVWSERFFVDEAYAPKIVESGKYVLPASHLAWFESPEDAAFRVLREMVNIDIPRSRVRLVDVQSHAGDGAVDDSSHWDICFVYQAELPKGYEKRLKPPEWFSEFGLRPKNRLKQDDFARGHGHVLEAARSKIRATPKPKPKMKTAARRASGGKRRKK